MEFVWQVMVICTCLGLAFTGGWVARVEVEELQKAIKELRNAREA